MSVVNSHSPQGPKPLVYQTLRFRDELQEKLDAAFHIVFPDSTELESRRGEIVGLIPDQIVDAKFLDQFPNLKVIGNNGVGCDHIDIAACKARGVRVGNTPGVLADATADMAFTLLLASARRIVEGDAIAKDPSTESFDPHWFGYEVSNSTLGIVGMGDIGTKIAKRALGFGMKILYNKRRRQEESVERALSAEYYPSLLEMLPKCDFLVLVIPGTRENDKMFSTKEFKAMKRSGILVNVGRGSVVDQEALHAALVDGTIAAAGVDVTSPEPLPRDHPLLKLPNLTISPHRGSATLPTRLKMIQLVIDNILCGLEGEPLVCEVHS